MILQRKYGKYMDSKIFMKDKDKALFRILLLCLGNLVLGFGNAICLQTGLGADALNVLFQGTAAFLELPVGTASLVASGVMVAATCFLDIKQLGIGTVLAPFACSFGIDVGMAVLPACTWFPANYGVMLLGVCTIALGLALGIYADCGKSSYDALIYGVMHRTNWRYHQIRWGLDLLFLAAGFLMGGRMTPATVIAVVVTGKIVTGFLHLLNKTNILKNE